MSNPFRTTQAPPLPSSEPPTAVKPLRIPAWLCFLGAAALFSTFLLFSVQSNGLPDRMKDWLTPLDDNGQVFAAQGDLNREEAQDLYRQALNDLASGAYEPALEAFKRLEVVYPGLRDMLWLHEAECYAGQGNEWAVQKKLTGVLVKAPGSVLKTVALYRIGQSQFRGGEWEKAANTFRTVRQKAPDSEYALGGLYYLGALSLRQGDTSGQGVTMLMQYLKRCFNCRFSGEAADLLERKVARPTPEQHALIGLANASSGKDPKKALLHLEKGNRAQTWLALGKARIHAGQVRSGLQALNGGLVYAKDMETLRDGVDTILANEPPARHTTVLKALADRRLPLGGDYILWKLAEADPTHAEARYQALLRTYPKGDYAPESAWRLLWPTLSAGNTDVYIAGAKSYLSRYPYARSAPKALFWIARLSEKSSPTAAMEAYNRLLDQYPASYYAFRAEGRLAVLRDGKTDPGWPTLAGRADYPPEAMNLNTLDILPPVARFGAEERGSMLRSEARELQLIGAAEDVRLLVGEALGKLPPAVESWAAQVSGDRPKGLRIIREALDERAKEAFIAASLSGSASTNTIPTTDEMKLLYPLCFAELISMSSAKNTLDPYLVQALAREESYFNEFAISTSDARGLMQLLPSTAQDVAGWESLSAFQTRDLFLPEVNIQLGSRYLAHLHGLFNGNAMPAVGAYNGGPAAMQRWVRTSPDFSGNPDMFVERIPYEQSRDYIKKVFAGYWNYTRLYGHANR